MRRVSLVIRDETYEERLTLYHEDGHHEKESQQLKNVEITAASLAAPQE